jgi:phosphoglycolate phosphatase-like HAD superfamily hydrolase
VTTCIKVLIKNEVEDVKKLFVWDFHGTLEKGNELAAIEISNSALQKHGFKERFTYQDAINLYGRKWFQYFEYLLPDEPHETHVMLQHECFEWPNVEEIVKHYLKPNDHVLEVLGTIKNIPHDQILLSNTSTKALPIFIAAAGLNAFFDETNSFAVMAHSKEVLRSKVHVLQEILEGKKYDDIIVVGDSLSDMELAKIECAKGFFYRHPGQSMEVALGANIRPINDLREILAEV